MPGLTSSLTDLKEELLRRNRLLWAVTVTGMTVAMLAPATTSIASPAPPGQMPSPAALPGGAATRTDFNGDGIPDLVVSTGARLTYPGDPDLTGPDKGGSVYVIPGGTSLPAATPTLISQDSYDFIPGSGEADDRFGQALATGDFNADGLADVAIGNASESFGSVTNVGMVTILYGKRDAPYVGIVPVGLNEVDEGTVGIQGDPEAGDLFGASLVTGDFNGDGYADLAVGAPGESLGTATRAGAVYVIYGSSNGLTATNPLWLGESTTGMTGDPETGDLFGWALAAGDVTGDGKDDLAISASGEAVSGYANGWGGVWLVPGSSSGPNPAASSAVSVKDAGTAGHLRSLVIGRFHGGSNADVVVTADQKKTGAQYSGALVVLRGASTGISNTRVQVIAQGSAGIPGSPEENDFFGGSLAVGDLDGDGADDLAAGALREDNLGMVWLMRGGTAGLLSAPATVVSENSTVISASGQPGEGFGYGLRILDVSGDGKPELLVTAPWEDSSLSAGTLFELSVGLSGDSFTLTGSVTVSRGTLGNVSKYGPATPIAGGTVVMMDNYLQP
jgi:hypothetical protein